MTQQPEADFPHTGTAPPFIKKEHREEVEGIGNGIGVGNQAPATAVIRGEIEAYNMSQRQLERTSQATAPRPLRTMAYASTPPPAAPSASASRSHLPPRHDGFLNIYSNAGPAEAQLHAQFGEEFQPRISGTSNFLINSQHRDLQPHSYHGSSSFRSFTSSPHSDYANTAAMSLSYESTNYMQESRYPVMMHEDTTQQEQDIQALQHVVHGHEQNRYPSPPIAGISEDPYQQKVEYIESEAAAAEHQAEIENITNNLTSNDPEVGNRSPPPRKPERELVRENGRFICTFEGCQEEKRDFGRKCEWNKHMDKHDRPYKCAAEGCQKLPGFTYSGGLLRHEREVHGKHGGPRRQLNCPHVNCKRHNGKGFSRQENLNEHLRRVHTDNIAQPEIEIPEEEDKTEAGQKRKRGASRATSDGDIREEVKRLKAENDELRRSTDFMAAQIRELQHNQSVAELQRSAMQSLPEEHDTSMPQARML